VLTEWRFPATKPSNLHKGRVLIFLFPLIAALNYTLIRIVSRYNRLLLAASLRKTAAVELLFVLAWLLFFQQWQTLFLVNKAKLNLTMNYWLIL